MEVDEERRSSFRGKLRVRLNSIPKMLAVCVGVGAKEPTTNSDLGGLDWVNLKGQVALIERLHKVFLGVVGGGFGVAKTDPYEGGPARGKPKTVNKGL